MEGHFPSISPPAKEVHPLNVAIPIIVTVSGTSISEVNEIQSLNTLLGNLLSAKPFGIFTLSSEVQP